MTKDLAALLSDEIVTYIAKALLGRSWEHWNFRERKKKKKGGGGKLSSWTR